MMLWHYSAFSNSCNSCVHILKQCMSLWSAVWSVWVGCGWEEVGTCLYRDAAALARLVVGAFTIAPSTGVVPPNGQALISVDCAPELAGYVSEVLLLSLSVFLCPFCLSLYLLVNLWDIKRCPCSVLGALSNYNIHPFVCCQSCMWGLYENYVMKSMSSCVG